jgi:hypothetical protein
MILDDKKNASKFVKEEETSLKVWRAPETYSIDLSETHGKNDNANELFWFVDWGPS